MPVFPSGFAMWVKHRYLTRVTQDAPVGASRSRMFAGAGLVLGALLPATMVIPVIRRFVEGTWPGHEWLMHAFMAANLLGACTVGPWLTAQAEQRGQRKRFAAGLAVVDGVAIALVSLGPPIAVMLSLRFLQGAASVAAVSLLMGSIRGRATSNSSMGLIGASVVLALVLGIPLGAIVGKQEPSSTLLVGAGLGVSAGLLALVVFPGSWELERNRISIRELWARFEGLRFPTAIVALERLGVGSMTVTLSLFGHHVLGVEDAAVTRWFSIFLVTFALAMWPIARLGDRLDRSHLLQLGALAYALMFLALGFTPVGAMPLTLVLGGIGSAALYGPSLGLVATSVPQHARSSAMAVMNAAGTLGMFVGNVMGLVTSQLLLSQGVSRGSAYTAVFLVAGMLQFCSMVLARKPVEALTGVNS